MIVSTALPEIRLCQEQSRGVIRIGTSAGTIPAGRGTWNGVFYPPRRPRGFDELAYYAERFDTVEVNSTFYRMPEAAMSEAWVRRTPPSFLFAVKLYQKFTHPDMYLARDGVSDWDLSRDDFDLFRAGVDPIADGRPARGRPGAVPAELSRRAGHARLSRLAAARARRVPARGGAAASVVE